ncbi:MAG: ABC transporter permease [Blastocatellia bacterium]
MFRHLLKLVWNRKRANFLIILEMLISFLVIFAVSLLTLSWANNYRLPLGYDYHNVWAVSVTTPNTANDVVGDGRVPGASLRQMLRAARELPEVLAAAGMSHSPYSGSKHGGGFKFNQRFVQCEFASASDELPAVLGINVTRGRWFNDEDASSNYRAVVINQQMARETWGNEDPLGKIIEEEEMNNAEPQKPRRVVGVISEFRLQGEFETPVAFVFNRRDPAGAPGTLLLRTQPGVTAAFEEKLLRHLQANARDAAFSISPLEGLRETNQKLRTIPLTIFGLITAFLMLMVALGLLGVLYQNVTQRTREIGLRRALGAPARAINRQILAELLLMASLGVLVGVLMVAQFPLLEIFAFLSAEVFLTSMAIALVIIYSLTIFCGLYPSWMATRVPPAEALHYD